MIKISKNKFINKKCVCTIEKHNKNKVIFYFNNKNFYVKTFKNKTIRDIYFFIMTL